MAMSDLEAALEEFGRLATKPVLRAHIGEPESAASRRPIEHTGTAFRPMNRSVSPNQFSLPGMEHQAHPLARHVAEGVHFESVHTPGRHWDYTGRQKPPWSFRPEAQEHSLYAYHGGEQIGQLHWAGEHPETRSHYPGEVTWVRRDNRPEDDDEPAAGPPKHRGIMADMFAAGHETNFGQTTVPVHSTERSPEGERWSAKVGPPELRPKRGQDYYDPPAGIHPYERAGSPPQLAGHVEGQRPFKGMSGLELTNLQRDADIGRRKREDREMRESGDPF